MAISTARNREQRDLVRRRATVDARAEMARDRHDVVAHRMSLVAVRAETAPYSHPEMSAQTRAVLADIADDARGALAEMRERVERTGGRLHIAHGEKLGAPGFVYVTRHRRRVRHTEPGVQEHHAQCAT